MNNVQIFLAMCYITLVSAVLFGMLHSVFTYIMWWGDRRDNEIQKEVDKQCAAFIKKVEARSGNTRFLIEGTDDVNLVAARNYIRQEKKRIETIDFEVIK